MIRIQNIFKRFDKVVALNHVDFEVNDGEIVGLLGENGAGKSTLLRILSTMLESTTGGATIDGYDITEYPEKVRKNIGILFGSEVGLYERLTAKENLEYFAQLNGMKARVARRRINELAERFSFADYQDKYVGQLSKGMKQKIAIARSIIHNPTIMLFDEPDSGLDFKASRTVFKFMEECKREGKCIVFSSHSMDNIKNYSDRMVVLHKGKVAKILNVEEYRKKYSEREINEIIYNLVCDGDDDV